LINNKNCNKFFNPVTYREQSLGRRREETLLYI
jgi:hypothetical protein